MTILPFGSRVVFEIKDGSRECEALHFVICEAKCRAHWYLFPCVEWPLILIDLSSGFQSGLSLLEFIL